MIQGERVSICEQIEFFYCFQLLDMILFRKFAFLFYCVCERSPFDLIIRKKLMKLINCLFLLCMFDLTYFELNMDISNHCRSSEILHPQCKFKAQNHYLRT